jgi:hypothetical protein
MQQYDITVPANMPLRVSAAGRYIKYLSGSNGGGDASIMLTPGMQGGNKLTLAPGFAYRVADDQPIPDSWTIANAAGGNTIIGKVIIGNGRVDDSTVQGVVQVVDGNKALSLNGSAGTMSGAYVLASNIVMQGITNQAGSGKRVIVSQMLVGSAAAQNIYIGSLTVPLGSLGVPSGQVIGTAFGGAARSGKAASTTDFSAYGANAILGVAVGAGVSQLVTFPQPLVIPPGYGLAAWNSSVGTNLVMSIPFVEELNV